MDGISVLQMIDLRPLIATSNVALFPWSPDKVCNTKSEVESEKFKLLIFIGECGAFENDNG